MSLNTKIRKEKSNEAIIIPEDIQKIISQRGFYLYEWIWNKDVKESIERDFLELLSKYGLMWAVLLILPTAISLFWGFPYTYSLFWILFITINICFLWYIFFTSIIRSKILRKNNQVLITDRSVSINGNIIKLDDNKIINTQEIDDIKLLFEEELFNSSYIYISKRKFQVAVFEKMKKWYTKILSKSRNSWKNWGQLIAVLLALYTVYVLSLGIVYFIGIILIWIFWIIISIINKKILLITGHEITTINNSFENIDEYSKKLETQKDELIQLLADAKNNDWKDSLLTKINSGIEIINNQANKAVNQSIDLKKWIEKSKYSEMFNFWIYNSWIKKQILIPLEEIHKLLVQNINLLERQVSEIDIQLDIELDSSKKWALSMSKTRSIMRSEEIKKHIENMEVYIEKLK